MKRLKQRVGYEEMNGRIGVPNGIGTPVTVLKGIVRANFANRLLKLHWAVFPLFLIFSNRSEWRNPCPQFHSFSAILSDLYFLSRWCHAPNARREQLGGTIADLLLPDSTTVNHKLVKDADADGIGSMRQETRCWKG